METLKGFNTGELLKYTTASWRVGSAYCFYVLMNKNKWNSLPPDAKKVFTKFSHEFAERRYREWNNIDIEGRDYFLKHGGQPIALTVSRLPTFKISHSVDLALSAGWDLHRYPRLQGPSFGLYQPISGFFDRVSSSCN